MRPRLVDIGVDGALSVPGTGVILSPYYNVGNPEHPVKPAHERWGALLARDLLSLGL